MGGFCGWSGGGIGFDMSQQTVRAMLAECRGTATVDSVGSGVFCVCDGLYTTSYHSQARYPGSHYRTTDLGRQRAF